MPSITPNHTNSPGRAELANLACELLATWYPAVPQSLIRCQVETLRTDHLSDFADAATDSATAERVGNGEKREGVVDDDDDDGGDGDDQEADGDDSSVNTRDLADLNLLDPETRGELLRDVELDASYVLSSTGSSEIDEEYVVLPPLTDDFPVLIFQDDVERCQRSHEEIRQVLHFLKIEQFVRTRPPRTKPGERVAANAGI